MSLGHIETITFYHSSPAVMNGYSSPYICAMKGFELYGDSDLTATCIENIESFFFFSAMFNLLALARLCQTSNNIGSMRLSPVVLPF